MKKRLITSALPYVNNVPHLGNIIGSVLSADTFARYCRSNGYETLYICATDEYGTATENKAREEGKSPKEICDHYHEIHKKIYAHFDICFDYFGRTSYPEQTEVTQAMYRVLEKNKFLKEQTTEQLYCSSCQIFLADRFIEGICPHCDYGEARGDQCDNCGKLLQPTELKSPECKFCSRSPVFQKTKHLYLDLPKLETKLKDFYETRSKDGFWPKNAATTTQKWIESGLQLRPITRDLSWGVPVPRPGYEEKVFYVWFDAVLGYISNTIRAVGDKWESWWKTPEETELYQFMAKDNIPFHTIIFPAMQIGSGENWTMLKHISSTEYLNYENTKFSKSRNIGVFGDDVISTGIPVDLWRFYLLINRPEKSDTKFSWELFFNEVNSEFIDNIGNLLNRVLSFLHKNYDGKWAEVDFEKSHAEFFRSLDHDIDQVINCFESVRLKEALERIVLIGKFGNKYFQDHEPWKKIKSWPKETLELLVALIILLCETAILLSPFMPETSDRILEQLNIQNKTIKDLKNRSEFHTHSAKKPSILFQKPDPNDAKMWQAKFSGKMENQVCSFEKVLLVAGKILSVKKHPNADGLYIEEIDIGEEKPRQIVSGLVKYYEQEELQGKNVIVVANLKPAKLRGEISEGMLLAAESKKNLELMSHETSVGSVVTLENDPLSKKPASININEFFETTLEVKDYTVFCGEKKLHFSGCDLKTKTIESGKIS